MKNKHCDWCDHAFQTKISYQIYCSPDCRNAATKEKIAARYQVQRRHKRREKPKLCRSCNKPLSVYNDGNICEACLSDPTEVAKALREIKGLINAKDRK